jgi:hypothetical protein
MASRQEEKERRRLEREQREQAQARAAANKRRLQLAGGAILGIAIIAVLVVVLAGGGSGDSSAQTSAGGAPIPARAITDFDEAVAASGCVYKQYPSEGRTHLASDTATFDGYKTNPPTSGNHRPKWAEDGVYDPDNTPDKENTVHALEHGRIEIQYSPSAPLALRDQLKTLYDEGYQGTSGYHTLLFQNQTNMPYEVAATAWTQSLTCKTANPKIFDAIRAFRDRFIDKGPEIVP